MDTDTCTGKRGPFKCRGMLLQYDSGPGIVRQAFCTNCYAEWIISKYGDGCVKFEKLSPCPITLPKVTHHVNDISELQRGDHVTWNDGAAEQHGIVGKLPNASEIKVFYINPNGKNEITKTTLDLTKSALYLVDYSSCEISGNNTVEQTILRARSHAKRANTFASSQQFAIFCKTGYVSKFQIIQQAREAYEDIVAVYPTMFSLEFATNAVILVLNILLSILLETLVECGKCSRRQVTTCSRRTYWFLSEICLLLLELLVFLSYVIYQLYVTRSKSEKDGDYYQRLHSGYWKVIPYFSEYLCGVGFASLSLFCNLRGKFCVVWCKVLVGIIFGVLGKIVGHIIGHISQKRLENRFRRRYIDVND